MIYAALVVVLSLLGAFTFFPRFKPTIERYQTGINFFLTLLATLIGVILAISISEYEAKQTEKEKVIKLLSAAVSSVQQSRQYTSEIIRYFDSLSDEKPDEETFYERNRPPFPEYLDVFVSYEIVSTNLSGTTLSDLNEYLINLKRSQSIDAHVYLDVLDKTQRLLLLEIDFQKGAISALNLEREADKLTESIKASK